MSYNWFDFYRYSIYIGLKYLLRFPYHRKLCKEGIKRLLVPMDIARYFEIPATVNNLNPSQGENILDLSSAKLVALFLADKVRCNVTAVDVWDKEIKRWKTFVEILDPDQRNYSLLKLEIADGRNLPYPDSFFDKIYSISVIEHIMPEEDGDIRAMKELTRVLKPHGRLVLTVPYSKKYYVTYVNSVGWATKEGQHEKVLWARRYDKISLKERLIEPTGLKLIKHSIWTEKIPCFSRIYGRFLPFSAAAGLFLPLFSIISLREVAEDKPNEMTSLANVLVVLEKSGN